MGPPLEALSPPGALGRRHPGALGRVGSNGLTTMATLESAVSHQFGSAEDKYLQEHQLRALRFLPSVIKLQRVLMERYQRKIARAEANNLKVSDFLDSLQDGV